MIGRLFAKLWITLMRVLESPSLDGRITVYIPTVRKMLQT